MNTTENNKKIAGFMGAIEVRENNYRFPNKVGLPLQIGTINYHSDWNWLMEVVEKIETLEIDKGYIDFHIMPDAIIVCNQNNEDNPLILINKSEGLGSIEVEPYLFEDKKQAVYKAVIAFIDWYNENGAKEK